MVEGVHSRMVLSAEVDVINLSLGGVAIRAKRRLNIGSEYALTLNVDDRELRVKGVVVWSTLSDIARRGEETVPYYSAGLRFSDVLSQKVQDLIAFIDRHKIAQEHRLSGIRFLIKAEGKAQLDSLESYAVKLVSLSGMLIEADRSFRIEETYAMEIQPPGRDPISFSGRVASHLELDVEGANRHQIGIEFLDMSPVDREKLKEFIAHLADA